MTLTIYGWMIPTIITIITIGWVIFRKEKSTSYFSDMGRAFLLIPALGISLVSWIIYAILK